MNQPPLPFEHLKVPAQHVEWLRLANAGNYQEKKWWFYPFKTRFLRQHALPDGHDLQIITVKCWCGDGIWRGIDDHLPKDFWQKCQKCGGTGIYMVKRIPLIRWIINGQLFHEPNTALTGCLGIEYKETFEGLIKHAEVPESVSRRSMERLFLRYEPGKFYDLWLARWRSWRDWQGRQLGWRVRRVKQLISFTKEDEVPF